MFDRNVPKTSDHFQEDSLRLCKGINFICIVFGTAKINFRQDLNLVPFGCLDHTDEIPDSDVFSGAPL